MSMQVTLGGKRLGAGNKNKVELHGYSRSTHNVSNVWRSTMAPGTLVPFMKELSLPGDTWEIDLGLSVLTHPTVGPLFGTYDVYLDVFSADIRLYQAMLHMNLLNLGRDMSKVKLPLIELTGGPILEDMTEDEVNAAHVNPSCILRYLGISGVGSFKDMEIDDEMTRKFNALPFLAYWDIYKTYYANKQEEIGAVIHTPLTEKEFVIDNTTSTNITPTINIPFGNSPIVFTNYLFKSDSILEIEANGSISPDITGEDFHFLVRDAANNSKELTGKELFWKITVDPLNQKVTFEKPKFGTWPTYPNKNLQIGYVRFSEVSEDDEPKIEFFDLENLDTMRDNLLMADRDVAYVIDESLNLPPYNLPLKALRRPGKRIIVNSQRNQEGLAIKTYKSDKFNAWVNTEWLDGVGGVNDITAVDTSGGSFTINALILNRKIYDMMMRITVTGGTYEDWQMAVYDHPRQGAPETPVYMGGLVRNVAFQEVISNAETNDQPLGTLAGRGVMGNKHKGGKVVIKSDQPAYILGIVSIVPNIDYYQGNDWDTNLKTLNDLHKPALDQIGFQDLITDEMAFWDTMVNEDTGTVTKHTAGKNPAWLDYMTNYNRVFGNFQQENEQAFMVLTRRYESEIDGTERRIKDLTTYIDPVKHNQIFAYTRRDAQNFWVQIVKDVTVRRKMSAKVMPNL